MICDTNLYSEIATFLIFPYFMESHVVSALPSLWMMDYQVESFASRVVQIVLKR